MSLNTFILSYTLNGTNVIDKGILTYYSINEGPVAGTTNYYQANFSDKNFPPFTPFTPPSYPDSETIPGISLVIYLPINSLNNLLLFYSRRIIESESELTINYINCKLDGVEYVTDNIKRLRPEFLDSKLTYEVYFKQTQTPTPTPTTTAVFSPEAQNQAATTKTQTSALLITLDPENVFLSSDQITQIASEAGKIVGHSVSIGEGVNNIVKAFTKN